MSKDKILNELMSGQLIGDVVKNILNNSIHIIRHQPNKLRYVKSRFNLLHSTDALINDVLIGHAQTFIKGDFKEWEKYKDIRMNVLLNQFGYEIISAEIDKNKKQLNRVIISRMIFGNVKIIEQLYINKLIS